MNDPSDYLVAPAEPDDSISNGFVNPLDLFNYVSPVGVDQRRDREGHRFNDASLKINTAGSIILGIFGTGMDVGYKGGDLSTVALPAAAYTNPRA